MVGIETTLREILDAVDYPLTTPLVVKAAYEATDEDFKVPLIIIEEIENGAFKRNAGGSEQLTNLTYQIDIYCRSLVYDDVPMTQADAVKSLASNVAAALTVAGLTRVDGRMLPYSTEVARYTLRYTCVIDASGYYYSR